MSGGALRHFGRILAWTTGGLAGLALAAFVVAWSGIFNVAASRGHWAFVEWFLAFGMRNSVELRAMAIQPPPLDDPNLVTLGAAHFHGGCAFCHGTPGTILNPIARHMLPSPPDLKTSMRSWMDGELFWIVKHGLKYTGMPGWVALERADEIWAVVAFLKQMPNIDSAKYRALALGSVQLPGQTGEQLATIESNRQAAGACARCHGAEDVGPSSALVPLLHGQPAEFLAKALSNTPKERAAAASCSRSRRISPRAIGGSFRNTTLGSRLPSARRPPLATHAVNEAAGSQRRAMPSTESQPATRVIRARPSRPIPAWPGKARLTWQDSSISGARATTPQRTAAP